MEQREKTTTESGALFSLRRVLLFDLDGTLTDPGEGITNSVAYALQKSGVTPPAREALYPFIGPPLMGAFEAYYGFTPEQSRRRLRTIGNTTRRTAFTKTASTTGSRRFWRL